MKTVEETSEVERKPSVSVPDVGMDLPRVSTIPVGFIPTPTVEYRARRKTLHSAVGPATPRHPIPIPIPRPLAGARVLMWKQDPAVQEIGIRRAFLPGHVSAGPREARIVTQGLPTVTPNVFGDLIEVPGTDAFDAVHTFAVVRETLTMYQRALGSNVLWQWNTGGNTDPIKVFPHAGVTMNAYYSRQDQVLKFFFFNKPGDPAGPPWNIFTCRSLDIVSHETGHAVLDGLKPHWIDASNLPQTGGLHESFGDLSAIFLTLSQFDQVEAIIAQTKANLHDKTFLSDLAEQFGLVLGRTNGLRNADNDLKLSEVGTEVHAISQVFTGAIYDILADIFDFERRQSAEDAAYILYESGKYVRSLLLRAIQAAPAQNATFADVANQMLIIVAADKRPTQYGTFIRNRFVVREALAATVTLDVEHKAGLTLAAAVTDHPKARQNRVGCCGTMMLDEYHETREELKAEMKVLEAASSKRQAA
jgi:hypothetical protein